MKRFALATALLLAANSSYASERIISAGAAITELINAMGAQEQLVAVDITSQSQVKGELPVLGYHRQLSAESLIALSPTRLLGSNEMGPKTTLDLIQQAGIKVEVVNSGETVDDLLSRIEQVGELTKTEKEAHALQAQVQQKVDSIHQTLAQQTVKKKVLFLMIHEGRPANVAGRNTTADSVIQLAGAINPAAAAVESYKPISLEAMVDMQPDIILLSSRTLSQIGSVDDLLTQMPLLAATPAGQKKAIVTIDGTALIGGLGLKSLSEAERLNHAFYPQ
ncbi:heme/hemin ABC transporter substrate-binding protein [Photobacterium lutimaris]|uniref:Hemin ABC transporter substrate-binding protein n=1 Tax=Photobacterium lutimaris TaxID=388278 RepID=A0A2T3J008_9GAMM|nr:ABC transporter substrate-binding protein [Photobacterium lutimaris]PSU34286.1 hemin ABC transporter substrate-binding protein [Photobacterium lutimaris]TDR75876.1 iron complex transport system substrate-binding protein [Photobacterium lutimaris]